jgi:hypothetical protein
MVKNQQQLHVHLVGSVPLADAEAVFRIVSTAIGPQLLRLPDGETGARCRWAGMLGHMLNRHLSFEPDTNGPPLVVKSTTGKVLREVQRLRIRRGIDARALHFETGYAAMAIDSFIIFDRLQREGAIPKHVRFQISIPSPLAPTYNYISHGDRDEFLDVFTNHLCDEVRQISAALPNERITIQWDVLHEILIWEGYFQDRSDHYKTQIVDTLGRIGEAVPTPIELGYHLCYGATRGGPLLKPRDAAAVVTMIREVLRQVRRPIQYIHFPVPQDRTDAAFFRPFSSLSVRKGTELYAGLIYLNDERGNRKRLECAREYVAVSGVASECGWGRYDPACVDALLETTRALIT